MPDGTTPSSTSIPGPKGRLFLGNLQEARQRPLEYMLELTREYGDVCQVRLGPTRLIIVNQPELVKQVLVDRHATYGRPAFVSMMRRLVGNGLLFSEGDFWLRQRRMVQPTFHRERIAGFARTMGEAVSARVATWRSPMRLDMTHEIARLTFEIVGRTLFSTDLSSDASELGAAIGHTLRWLDQRTVQPLAAPLFVPTPDNLRFRAAQKLFTQTIARLIHTRRVEHADPGDLLSMLLAARDPETGAAMSDKQLHDELLTFLIAGYETTSAALEWSLILLAQHPDVAARVRAEQHAVCGARPPMPEDMPRMPYTRMVLDEALRLYPPVFGLSRRTVHDDQLAGHHIPMGSHVLVSPYAMHRSPALWQDPDRFDPERFAPALAKQRPRFAHFPFGGGPRQCIGNAFAMMELQVLVPTLLGALQIELADSAVVTPQPRMTLRPSGPVMLNVRPTS